MWGGVVFGQAAAQGHARKRKCRRRWFLARSLSIIHHRTLPHNTHYFVSFFDTHNIQTYTYTACVSKKQTSLPCFSSPCRHTGKHEMSSLFRCDNISDYSVVRRAVRGVGRPSCFHITDLKGAAASSSTQQHTTAHQQAACYRLKHTGSSTTIPSNCRV